MNKPTNKQSYTVPCASAFRDAIQNLADRKNCNVADLARSVVLVVSADAIAQYPDPGEPEPGDRETIVLKSGRSAGKPWRRKPRLQVRMAPGLEVPSIRKALALALAIERGHLSVDVATERDKSAAKVEEEAQIALLRDTRDELERLRATVQALHFEPLPGGVHKREDALYVLGFPPGAMPDLNAARLRFRRLATVYHPDGKHGDHQRMSQINAAMDILRRGGR